MQRIPLPFAEVWVRGEDGRLPTAEQLRRIGFRVSSVVYEPENHGSAGSWIERPQPLALPLGRQLLALPGAEDQSLE